MPQSGLTSRDRRVRRSRTAGAKIIVSLISFLACLYESSLPPRSESHGGNHRRIELLREIREGGRRRRGWTTRSEHLDRRGTSSALLGSEIRKIIAGQFPGHAFVETLLEHQVSLLLPPPRLALDVLRGCGAGLIAEKASTGAATGPRRKYGCGTVKCSQSNPAMVLLAIKRYPRIAKSNSTFRFLIFELSRVFNVILNCNKSILDYSYSWQFKKWLFYLI